MKNIQLMADEGNTDALYSLGVLYEQGYCVRKDRERAISSYRRAAQQGNPQAQYRLGLMLRDDCDRMKYWWEQAAMRGYDPAQLNLAQLYRAVCPGMPADPVHALMWYEILNLAKERPTYDLVDFLGEMSPAQIAESGRLAREWISGHFRK